MNITFIFNEKINSVCKQHNNLDKLLLWNHNVKKVTTKFASDDFNNEQM